MAGFTETCQKGNAYWQDSRNSQHEVAGGRHITIAVLRDSHWKKFCTALSLPALAGDERYATNSAHVANRDALNATLVPLLKSNTADYWLERLRAADILCGPVNTVADVLADPALAACLPILDIGLPEVARAIGSPIRYDGEFFAARHPPPVKGEHTREVLTAIGYGIEALLASGSAFVE